MVAATISAQPVAVQAVFLANDRKALYGAEMTELTDTHAMSRSQLLALLDWYRAAGVEDAVGEVPVDWLSRDGRPPLTVRDLLPGHDASPGGVVCAQRPERQGTPSQRTEPPAKSGGTDRPAEPVTSTRPSVQPSREFITVAPDVAVQDARSAAADAQTLAELGAKLATFDGCGLRATAKNLCLYRGAEQAQVMIVGEAPGREEDQAGRPFVGRAGQLLDKMLAAIGLDEGQVHITNVVYWRPPGNRTPTPVEVQVCRPFLERQIALVRPRVLLTLGGPAAKALVETTSGIMKVRGAWRDVTIGDQAIRLMPTLHPAYLLRTPAAKRLAWRDLLAIRAFLDDEK